MFSRAINKTLRSVLLGACIVIAGAASAPSSAGQLGPPGALAAARVATAPPATAKAAAAAAEVVEYYLQALDNYFITADPTEQAFVDSGAVGAWRRTGNSFPAGGPDQVCRFYGNTNINPATGTIYGPNSHFYTADPAECAALKAQYNPNAKSWKFESNDFLTTKATNGACPAGLVPVYRAYNNGFARGVDSNHRITSNLAAYQQTVAAGWSGEGIVMCAPSGLASLFPPQLAACGASDCPAANTPVGNGTNLVNVIVEIPNTTSTPIIVVIPAGQTFVSTLEFQGGLAVERIEVTIAPGTIGRYVFKLFCMNQDRHASSSDAHYSLGPVTTNAQLVDLVALADGKLGPTRDPATVKAAGIQFAIWEITNGSGALTATGRNLLVQLLATAADDFATQSALFEQFQQTLTPPTG